MIMLGEHARIEFDERNLRAWLRVDARAAVPAPAACRAALLGAGVLADCLLDLESVLGGAQARDDTVQLPIARGKEPEHGENGRLEFLIDLDASSPGTIDEQTGKIDFRERNLVREVREGDDLAQLHMATNGIEGMDLWGSAVEAVDGEPADAPRAGEGVVIEREGLRDLYRAAVDGVVLYYDRELSVSKVLRVPGDVDFKTGNLRFDGPIHIGGSVKSGFEVVAGKALVIDGFVEPGARVQGLSVTLMRGCYGDVRAILDLQAPFVEQCRLRAGRRMLVKKAYRCVLQAQHIQAHLVTACRIQASGKVLIDEIGDSPLGTTQLIMRYDRNIQEWINQARAQYSVMESESDLLCMELQQHGVRVQRILEGKGMPWGPLDAEVEVRARELVELRAVINRFAQSIQSFLGRSHGRMRVTGLVPAMTVVDFYGATRVIFAHLKGLDFHYDIDEHEVLMIPLDPADAEAEAITGPDKAEQETTQSRGQPQ